MRTDPVERLVEEGLIAANIEYTEGYTDKADLDFYCPKLDIYIECKRFFAERILKQMIAVDNIIVIQGIHAAKAFKDVLSNSRTSS